MSFVQIIEYESDRPDEVRALSEQWSREQHPDAPTRMFVAEDREQSGHIMMVAEFDSYEQAMANSERPETSAYADRMRQLTRDEPRFVNLELTYQQI